MCYNEYLFDNWTLPCYALSQQLSRADARAATVGILRQPMTLHQEKLSVFLFIFDRNWQGSRFSHSFSARYDKAVR